MRLPKNLRKIFNLSKAPLIDFLRKLPVGIWVEGDRLRNFRLNAYTTEHDLLLTTFYSDGEEEHEVDFLQLCCYFLPQIIESIEGYSIKELAVKLQISTSRLIQEMFAADILAILLNIRASNGGLDVAFGDICPACGTKNQDNPELGLYHSLEAIDITYLDSNGLIEPVTLRQGIDWDGEIRRSLQLQPIKFIQFVEMMQSATLQSEISTLMAQGSFTEQYFRGIRDLSDRNKIFAASKELSQVGPEMEMPVQMICRSCRHEWESLLHWEAMIQFYRDLLKPPPEKYLHDVIFFLTFGEQAPCKSIEEAKRIPVKQRDALVKKLSEVYENQKKEMEKSSKGKGKGNSTKKTY